MPSWPTNAPSVRDLSGSNTTSGWIDSSSSPPPLIASVPRRKASTISWDMAWSITRLRSCRSRAGQTKPSPALSAARCGPWLDRTGGPSGSYARRRLGGREDGDRRVPRRPGDRRAAPGNRHHRGPVAETALNGLRLPSAGIQPVQGHGGVPVLGRGNAQGDVPAGEAIERVVGRQLGRESQLAQAIAEGEPGFELLVIRHQLPVIEARVADVHLGAPLAAAEEPHARSPNSSAISSYERRRASWS